jgi:hypothetical protein
VYRFIWFRCYVTLLKQWSPICSVRTDGQTVGQTDMIKLIVAFPALRKCPRRQISMYKFLCWYNPIQFFLLLRKHNFWKYSTLNALKYFPSRIPICQNVLTHFRARSQHCERRLSFVMSARLSSWNNSAPIGRVVMKFDISVVFENPPKKIQVQLKSDKNNGHVTWRHFWTYLAHFFLEWGTFQPSFWRKSKQTFHTLFFFKKNLSGYEIM